MKIEKNTVVAFDYQTYDFQGTLIEDTADSEPLEYLHGHDQILPALEAALDGMQAGDEKDITLSPEEAYGEYDESLKIKVKRELFADNEEKLTLGNVVEDENGEEYMIIEIAPESVTIDGNHPLAGLTLNSKLKVLSVRQATETELAHGHVHHEGHCH